MSEPKLISPMLDNFDMGGPISEHHGVTCYPAMRKDSDDRYIVKTICVPASQTQLDALLLTGAYPDEVSALNYFKEIADGIIEEAEILQKLSKLEGFLPFEDWQLVTMDDRVGYIVYLLTTYKRTLKKHFQREPMTHLSAVNLGLDMCAALAICRRSGYLYANLCPTNIYVDEKKEYRIGDLGFIKLKSLKYASLPAKYRSQYTAPEIVDDFAPLNKTIDIYAAGLILYQAYNGGRLPFEEDSAPSEKFDAPMYADYEMAEIILKACDPDPANRWQDPLEMGQAIVSYMQRNGANDTPIVPPVTTPTFTEPLSDEEMDLSEFGIDEEMEAYEEEEADEAYDDVEQMQMPLPEDELAEEEESQVVEDPDSDEEILDVPEISEEEPEDIPEEDDELGNLDFLRDLIGDETLPENNMTDMEYGDVSDDLSEILSQADELVAHQIPDPVVAPDAIEVPIPEPISDEDETISPEDAENSETDESDDTVSQISAAIAVASDDDDAVLESVIAEVQQDSYDSDDYDLDDDEDDEDDVPVKKKSHWLRTVLIIVILAAIAVGGFFFYRYYYLQPINAITVTGNESSMVVNVDSEIDETLLSVVCSDSHGHQLSAPVVNGQATFSNLAPDTAYNVKIVVDGFHRLTGEVAASYSTPAQTNIVQFSAVTGPESGSVILSFTVEGPDSGMWSVAYSAEGEEEKTVELVSHMAQISGLTVGKEYTFKLVPNSEMYVVGTNELTFVASDLIYAEDLMILSCMDGKLTATWTAPSDVAVANWTVRCYNSTDYNNTIITSDTTAVFEDLDCSDSYTVEVTAAGMSVSERAYVAENAITISNFQADITSPKYLTLTWDSSLDVPEGGWVLLYTIEGLDAQGSVSSDTNSAEIRPYVPNATYHFTLQDTKGSDVLTLPLSCHTSNAAEFSGYGVNKDHFTFKMCKRPSEADWDRFDLDDEDYTNTFAAGDKVSILAKLSERYAVSEDVITAMFVFTDESGNLVSYCSFEETWIDMWYQFYAELDVPQVPTTAGNYKMSIYFNGLFLTEMDLIIQ